MTGYTLDTKELWLLLSQFGPAMILGVGNPFTGWLVEEIEAEAGKVSERLVEKRYAVPRSEGELDLADELYDILQACAQPEHTIMANLQHPNKDPVSTFVHIREKVIALRSTKNGSHFVQKIEREQEIPDIFKSTLRFKSTVKGIGKDILISEQALFDARTLTGEGKPAEAIEALIEGGANPESASRIVETLINPVANSSVVMILNQQSLGKQEVKGLSILEGKHYFWELQPEANEHVRLIPSDASAVLAKFNRYLP